MKLSIKVPHTYVLLFLIVFISAIFANAIPSGEYNRYIDTSTGRVIIEADSFQYIEDIKINIFDVFTSFHRGMVQSASLIFFILITAGSMTVIQETGVLYSTIAVLIQRYKHLKYAILILLIIVLSILGGVIGFSEEALALVPLVISMCNAMGFDNITALAVVMLGTRCGNTTGLMNPFVLGIAHEITELPLYSGLWYRIIWYILILFVTCYFVVNYTRKTEKALVNEKKSEFYIQNDAFSHGEFTLNNRFKLILLLIVAGFASIIYGVLALGWYMSEISAVFIIMSISCGFVGLMKADSIAVAFLNGIKEMVTAGLACGVASGVTVILNEVQIMDTAIYYTAILLGKLSAVWASIGMYIFHFFFAFLVPSNSAHAALTMPLMTQLSDFIGITRQTSVLAMHYGSGFAHLVMPTQGTLMAFLAISKVSFDEYFKWILPLIFTWIVIGGISVTVATLMRLGPF